MAQATALALNATEASPGVVNYFTRNLPTGSSRLFSCSYQPPVQLFFTVVSMVLPTASATGLAARINSENISRVSD